MFTVCQYPVYARTLLVNCALEVLYVFSMSVHCVLKVPSMSFVSEVPSMSCVKRL